MSIPNRLRFEVFRRDAFRCRYCRVTAWTAPLTVDHVMPVVLGGTDDIGNLVTACEPCNSGKGSMTPDERLRAALEATMRPSHPGVKPYVDAVITRFGAAAALAPPGERYEPHVMGNAVALWLSGWRGDPRATFLPPDDAIDTFECDICDLHQSGIPVPVIYTAASWAGHDKTGELLAYARALRRALYLELGGLPDRVSITAP
ncbi:HNH endonuclease [Streptomyces sp. NPDC058232]|uniref:HNH endonuclease n=1 Tax=Streptomyces sp. NPDC058232 TaxID=3346393 RepID=UPI0036EC14EC